MTTETTLTLRELLKRECGYVPSDSTLDLFLDRSEEIELDAGAILVNAGDTDSNMYVVAKG